MSRKLPNLSALRSFEAAARLGSFTEAAHELGLTQAAISKSVRRLEDELGFALFHRMHRAVSLTEDGARYAQQVTDAFRRLSVEGLDLQVRQPRVVLEADATFLRHWLLPRLREQSFAQLNVSLSIHSHEDHPRLIPAAAEVAITWGFADFTRFKRTRLLSTRTVLVAAQASEVSRLADVADHGLLHSQDDGWWRTIYDAAGMTYPESARAITFTRCDLPIDAANLGLGVAVADDIIAEQGLRSGNLVPVHGPRIDGQDYYLLTRNRLSVPAKKVADWILGQADQFGHWQSEFENRLKCQNGH